MNIVKVPGKYTRKLTRQYHTKDDTLYFTTNYLKSFSVHDSSFKANSGWQLATQLAQAVLKEESWTENLFTYLAVAGKI